MWRHSVVGCHWFVWATNFQHLRSVPTLYHELLTRFWNLQVIYELHTDLFHELFVDMFQVAVNMCNIGSGKSTFLQYFRESENVEIASEPVEMWKNVRGHNTLVSPNIKLNIFLITARKQSLQMLCFYTCLSVILFRGSTWAGIPPGR